MSKIRIFLGSILFLSFLSSGAAWAAENDDSEYEKTIGVTKRGVIHNIAEDRKVARITGGIYEPEGLDIYLKRHIDRLYTEMAALHGKMDQMESQMNGLQKSVDELKPPAISPEEKAEKTEKIVSNSPQTGEVKKV